MTPFAKVLFQYQNKLKEKFSISFAPAQSKTPYFILLSLENLTAVLEQKPANPKA